MAQADWLQMLANLQELHRLSRTLLVHEKKQTLTNSEQELLLLLYMYPDDNTPLALSRRSGMKKEAVSRCIRQLLEKQCVERNKHPTDERSYVLSLSETGNAELQKNYRMILQPLYELRRQMGPSFDSLFSLIANANEQYNVLNEK